MNETFRPPENRRYSETYRSHEYNDRAEEKTDASEAFLSSEFYNENQSKASASRREAAKAARQRRNVLTSGLFSAVSAAAGAAVIVVAVVLSAVISVTAVAFGVTSHDLFVDFAIENTDNKQLTAFLAGNDESYSFDIAEGETLCRIEFDFLTPETEYLLEVKDGDGNIHFSELYATAAYLQKLSLTEYGLFARSISLQFNNLDLTENDYDVYLDRVLQETKLNAAQPLFVAENLSPNTDYEVRVMDPVANELLFWQVFRTDDLLTFDTEYINGFSALFSFDAGQLPENDLNVMLNGKDIGQTIGRQNTELLLQGLTVETDYLIEATDPLTGELLLSETFTTPDVSVDFSYEEVYQTVIRIFCRIESPTRQNVDVVLQLGEEELDRREVATTDYAPGQSGTVNTLEFTDIIAGEVYSVTVRRQSDNMLLFRREYLPPPFIEATTSVGTTMNDVYDEVYLFDRKDDGGTDVNYVTYYSGENIPLSSMSFACFSMNDYTLPVDFYEEEGGGKCKIYTQYAKSGEVYRLQLFAELDEQTLLQEIMFMVNDNGTAVDYPTFEATVLESIENVSTSIEIAYTGGTLLTNENGEARYILQSDLFEGGELETDDFLTVPNQVVETSVTGQEYGHFINFVFVSGTHSYVVFSLNVLV